jgi:signal transduction histidine kinase
VTAPEPAARRARLALLARIGQLVTSKHELDELLDRAADLIHRELRFPNVDLPLLDPEDPGFLIVRARGGAYKERIRHVDRLSVATGIMGAAVRERRTQLVADVAADPRYVVPPSGLAVRAELAVPILLGEQVLGVLNVEGPEPFDEDDAITLETIAGFLAVAIRNAELTRSAQELAVVEERQRLARELHDSVTQLIFSAKLIAESLQPAFRRDAAEGERRMARLAQLLSSALAEMRSLLKELRPAEEQRILTLPSGEFPLPAAVRVRREGLASVLAERVAELERDGLAATLDARSWRRLPVAREEALLKVALELVANAVKHARARRLTLRLAAGPDGAELEVTDDGAGFDVRATLERAERRSEKGGGMGLLALRERVRELGGTLRFESEPGRGTHVRVSLPPADSTP